MTGPDRLLEPLIPRDREQLPWGGSPDLDASSDYSENYAYAVNVERRLVFFATRNNHPEG
ncbi:hypothetical protein [Dactylosporangium salmoneum]|uniref:Uncharacterized protein n=1 Tax=Dactylosporangium salmoneum TaxID=53361 RepID=A0ABP5UTP5_9ACTN